MMPHDHTATVRWQRQQGEAFIDKRYSRRHEIAFDGGVVLRASSSPHAVPLPYCDPGAVDPEEMFVAALASCHMLWFLSLAAADGFCVECYADEATGTLAPDAQGRWAMTRVTLRPRVVFAGESQPTSGQLQALHERAHDECFIAHSVSSVVNVEPRVI